MVDTKTKGGKAALVAALAVAVIGILVFIGWFCHIDALKTVLPGTVTMNPATALAMILAGTSLGISLRLQPQKKRDSTVLLISLARVCALVVALIGILRLVAIISGCDIGVDQWMFPAQVSRQLPFPSRIAPNVALNLLFLGIALLLVDVKKRSVGIWVEIFALVIGLGSLVAVLGYAYAVQSFYRFGTYIPMALNTAIGFLALSTALLLSHTDSGLLAILAGNSPGGKMARQLMPAVILAPAIFGWFELQGEMAGFFDSKWGNALSAVLNTLVFVFLVCWSAKALFRADLARKDAAEELHAGELRYRRLIESLPAAVYTCDAEGRVTLYNEAAAALWGRRPEIGKDVWCGSWRIYSLEGSLLSHENCPMAIAVLEGRSVRGVEVIIERPDGSRSYVLPHPDPIRDASGTIIGAVNMLVDLTERRRIEAQLLQSQKMEIVGKLAGGVAHEFNSILTAIIGQSETLQDGLAAGSAQAKSASEINKAAGRAAILTRQLLAYGRKQTFQIEILDLNAVLNGMESSVRHLMGGDSDVRIIASPGLKPVKADSGQIEQVIMNMVINAHDAMPLGGKLTLETSNVSLDQSVASFHPDLKHGNYVMLAITDTGPGMSVDVKSRVFDPFFSTKGIGEGTGLGLSTCYGIIKQSGGDITVYSELAQGTCFKIYLPQVKPQMVVPQPLDSTDLPRGTETVLLVGDDATLNEMAAILLERLGYKVLLAVNGVEALGLAQQRDLGPIDLLFTEAVMPHMSGTELAERMRKLNPNVKILFTVAPGNDVATQALLQEGVAFLPEPFTPPGLAHKLREVLNQ